MDAMILAAGLGRRLGPIGERLPKALIDVGGRPMIEHVALRLVEAGADRILVNVHHHADLIRRYVEEHDLGAPVSISLEAERPLETGGGLLHARPLFRGDAAFFLANVDIITDADLRSMYASHPPGRLATLATNARESKRRLLFDGSGLFGRVDLRSDTRIESRPPVGAVRARPFAGIHVISPSIFELMTERGAFSILEPYLRLAGSGHEIDEFDLGDAGWLEIGTPERLEEARRLMN
jgi:NDP-sugar pyrophosphorylase family protein